MRFALLARKNFVIVLIKRVICISNSCYLWDDVSESISGAGVLLKTYSKISKVNVM